MCNIKQHSFTKKTIDELTNDQREINWPTVYILEGKKKAYVGETTGFKKRMKQHLNNPERRKMNKAYQIIDDKFNRSATSDLEAMLIEYMAADGQYELQNGNRGLKDHEYYDKHFYQSRFERIWNGLMELNVAKHGLREIRNTDLFKLSPFKVLTDEQHEIINSIEKIIRLQNESIHVISGEPGSGKTVLAVYMAKYLVEEENFKDLKIGIVVPMTSLRKTLKYVFKSIKGLKANMVIGPSEVTKKEYDLLFVDEAHRLSRRKNLSNYDAFDRTCERLNLDSSIATQLDWIRASAKHLILFYDKNQTVKPTDVQMNIFSELNASRYALSSQFRIKAGSEYTEFIESLLKQEPTSKIDMEGYDFRIYDDVDKMIEEIKKRNNMYGLSRNVAGYCWKWISKDNNGLFDIEIAENKYRWNSTDKDWINSTNSINEIGCVHTTQGYDLNYCGVIIGPDLIYRNGRILYNDDGYKDKKAKDSTLSNEEMKSFIINIYKVLLTRGILGTYIYVCDDALREYLYDVISNSIRKK